MGTLVRKSHHQAQYCSYYSFKYNTTQHFQCTKRKYMTPMTRALEADNLQYAIYSSTTYSRPTYNYSPLSWHSTCQLRSHNVYPHPGYSLFHLRPATRRMRKNKYLHAHNSTPLVKKQLPQTTSLTSTIQLLGRIWHSKKKQLTHPQSHHVSADTNMRSAQRTRTRSFYNPLRCLTRLCSIPRSIYSSIGTSSLAIYQRYRSMSYAHLRLQLAKGAILTVLLFKLPLSTLCVYYTLRFSSKYIRLVRIKPLPSLIYRSTAALLTGNNRLLRKRSIKRRMNQISLT